MFDFDLSSITNAFSNMWNSGTSAVSNGMSELGDFGSSVFGSISNDMSSNSSIFGSFFGSSPISNSDSSSFFDFGGLSDIYSPSNFSMPSFGSFDSFFGGFDLSSMLSSAGQKASAVAGDFADTINQAAQQYGVEPKLIQAIMKVESGGDPNATSSCGAQGLMQMMPETFASTGYTDAYDPVQNIMAGASHIKSLMDHFGGDLTKVIAAYNAGSGAVEQYGGIPPYEETQNYVQKVMDAYNS